jgi:hypothetical protein
MFRFGVYICLEVVVAAGDIEAAQVLKREMRHNDQILEDARW